ncbi:MAG: FtsX-like permease family protein [Vicinamibacterales bacterium]
MTKVATDLRYVVRSIRARPGATAAMVSVLAIGVALTSAMFALADPFHLRPLQYRNPDRLAIIQLRFGPGQSEGANGRSPTIEDWEARTDLFEAVAAFGEQERLRVQGNAAAVALTTVPVSANFFDVLGIPFNSIAPWQPTDGQSDRMLAVRTGSRVAQLAPAEDLLGTVGIDAGGAASRIVSVLPRAFVFPVPRASRQPDAVHPANLTDVVVRNGRSTRFATGIARLRPNVTPAAAGVALSTQWPSASMRVTVEPLTSYMTQSQRGVALGAICAGLLIALVSAANAANLLIIRVTYQAREIATREALGATPIDMFRLVVLDLTVTAVASIAAGLVLAHAIFIMLRTVIPDEYTLLGQPGVTTRVAVFSLALATVMIAPAAGAAWLARRSARLVSINRLIAGESRKIRWVRAVMSAGQSAIAVILLTGGMLLARSQVALWSQDTGFDEQARHVSVSYPPSLTSARLDDDISRTVDALRALPGIQIAASAVGPLLDDFTTLGGSAVRIGGRTILLSPRQVTPGYFEALGTDLRAGRSLRTGDRGWNAVVINETFAKSLWPGKPAEFAVGQSIFLVNAKTGGEIVGVVKDTFDKALDVAPTRTIFCPIDTPAAFLPVNYIFRISDPTAAAAADEAAKRTVTRINREAVIVRVGAVDERLAATVKDRTFASLILWLFAIAGIGVTATGLFGLAAFVAARRTREIAVRVAMGARPRDIIKLVLREAVGSALVGGAAGLVAGHWLSTVLEHQLYGVEPGDLRSLVAAAASMLAIVALASWLPARRALRIAPSEALRIE